ncbi:hypothetical protein A9Z06_00905 [Rhizobium sp. YK2]|nr:hypothetical protein A9Z06_00905 [Rhizobium sp. YK2]
MMIKPSATSELIGYGRKKGGPTGAISIIGNGPKSSTKRRKAKLKHLRSLKTKGKKQPTHVLFVNNAP